MISSARSRLTPATWQLLVLRAQSTTAFFDTKLKENNDLVQSVAQANLPKIQAALTSVSKVPLPSTTDDKSVKKFIDDVSSAFTAAGVQDDVDEAVTEYNNVVKQNNNDMAAVLQYYQTEVSDALIEKLSAAG